MEKKTVLVTGAFGFIGRNTARHFADKGWTVVGIGRSHEKDQDWNHYDVYIKDWPDIRENGYLYNILLEKKLTKYWESIFDMVYKGSIDTWDYQWVFSYWIQGGLSIIPSQNLISNIGYGNLSTHTKGENMFSKMLTGQIKFPLVHPRYIIRDIKSDKYTEKIWFSQSMKTLFESKFNILLNKIR